MFELLFFCVVTLWRVRLHPHEQLLQNYKAQRHAVFLKIPYLSRMKNCSRHTDLFVRLFARAITSEVPPTLSVKISALYHNILIDYCREFSHMGPVILSRIPHRYRPRFRIWKLPRILCGWWGLGRGNVRKVGDLRTRQLNGWYGCHKDVRDAFHCLWMTSGYTSVTTRSTAETPQDTPGQHRDASGRLKNAPDGYTDLADTHKWDLRIFISLADVSLSVRDF